VIATNALLGRLQYKTKKAHYLWIYRMILLDFDNFI